MLRKSSTLARPLDYWKAAVEMAKVTGSCCHYQRRFQTATPTLKDSSSCLVIAIIKPHAATLPHVVDEIVDTIRDNGLDISRSRRMHLTRQQAEELYKEHRGRFFFQRATEMMSSGEVIALLLHGKDAVKRWRSLMGPTKVSKTKLTHPVTIRGRFGLTDTRNAVHGSDSPESTKRECQLLFPEFKMDKWDGMEDCPKDRQNKEESGTVWSMMAATLKVLGTARSLLKDLSHLSKGTRKLAKSMKG
ncbi:hypothetical protein RvY_10434 [Ramazzottius varieornatus]|uniref:Nucleoside diphosphate kinase n=1 Tax=Ramazzottius varieornatus TaxID=947166 RepID=A0A1D1VCS3_RAMVA|nr:hypothetical protein RvY_10434 [Ramazzottius varieornatus]